MNIAEKILKDSVAKALNIGFDQPDWYVSWWMLLDPQPSLRCIMRAMNEYADFFYWLGKEGWVERPDGIWRRVPSLFSTTAHITDLFEQYIKAKQ